MKKTVVNNSVVNNNDENDMYGNYDIYYDSKKTLGEVVTIEKKSEEDIIKHVQDADDETGIIVLPVFNGKLRAARMTIEEYCYFSEINGSPDMFFLSIPDESDFMEDYLLYALQQEDVCQQCRLMLDGDTELTADILKKIVVIVPSVEEQKDIVSKSRALEIAERKYALSPEVKRFVLNSDVEEGELRNHLSQLGSIRKVMGHMIDHRSEMSDFDEKIKEQMNLFDVTYDKFMDSFNAMYSDNVAPLDIIGFVYNFNVSFSGYAAFFMTSCTFVEEKEMIEAGLFKPIGEIVRVPDHIDFKNSSPEDLDCWLEYVKGKRTVYEGQVKYMETGDDAYVPQYVAITPEDMTKLLTTNLDNIYKHGDVVDEMDSSGLDYRFGYDKERGMLRLDITNWEKPYPEELTKEIYGRLGGACGETAGAGRGGYVIRRIMEKCGGDFDLIRKENESTLRLYFPIVNGKV